MPTVPSSLCLTFLPGYGSNLACRDRINAWKTPQPVPLLAISSFPLTPHFSPFTVPPSRLPPHASRLPPYPSRLPASELSALSHQRSALRSCHQLLTPYYSLFTPPSLLFTVHPSRLSPLALRLPPHAHTWIQFLTTNFVSSTALWDEVVLWKRQRFGAAYGGANHPNAG
jgi:hypothetical protein